MNIDRTWAMPNHKTFQIPPIKRFVSKYIEKALVSIDPFSCDMAHGLPVTYTNDLNPDFPTTYHLDAEDFIMELKRQGIIADLMLFDPPYSPRQISESYKAVGLQVGMKETQNGSLYSRVRNAALSVLSDDSVVLSFGWNSSGMGKSRGFEIIEMLIVAHGGAHNDTICVAERRK